MSNRCLLPLPLLSLLLAGLLIGGLLIRRLIRTRGEQPANLDRESLLFLLGMLLIALLSLALFANDVFWRVTPC